MSGAHDLRQYQVDVLDRIDAAIAAGHRRVLVVLPTGSGKTVIAAGRISRTVGRGAGVLVLAHRRELVQQASSKLYAAGIDHGIVQAGFTPRPGERVQIASVQTLHARAMRTSQIELPPATDIIVDEAHHAPARTYRDIVAAYPDAIVIGLTATPCRADGRGLGANFDVIIEGPTNADLIGLGFLVPSVTYAPTLPDLEGVKVERGDYVERQLAERMDKPQLVGDIVETWLRIARTRKTVTFTTGVAHSLHVRDRFRSAGVNAEHIDGGTPIPERDAILKRLSSGEIDLITNCAVLTEGWDQPDISAIILARPTKSFALYRQMTGRGTRIFPGKKDLIILDHAGAVFEHGFIEDPVTWTLDPASRPRNSSQSGDGTRTARKFTTCPDCAAVRLSGDPCRACGWRPMARPVPIEVIDGDLAQLDRSKKSGTPFTEAQRLQFLRELTWIAGERGYQSGWAAHKFREKFQTWPPRGNYGAAEPSDATRAWVRSRQIAYAKSQARVGAR